MFKKKQKKTIKKDRGNTFNLKLKIRRIEIMSIEGNFVKRYRKKENKSKLERVDKSREIRERQKKTITETTEKDKKAVKRKEVGKGGEILSEREREFCSQQSSFSTAAFATLRVFHRGKHFSTRNYMIDKLQWVWPDMPSSNCCWKGSSPQDGRVTHTHTPTQLQTHTHTYTHHYRQALKSACK
jgi:hypothetical protein